MIAKSSISMGWRSRWFPARRRQAGRARDGRCSRRAGLAARSAAPTSHQPPHSQIDATGTSIPLSSRCEDSRLRRVRGRQQWANEANAPPAYHGLRKKCTSRCETPVSSPRRAARSSRRSAVRVPNPGKSWTPSSSMPRTFAERRPPSCTSSRATCSASRESPARSRRSIASSYWTSRLPGTVRPSSGARPKRCAPSRFLTC